MTPQDVLTAGGQYPLRPVKWPPPAAVLAAIDDLVTRVSRCEELYLASGGKPFVVSSGYRPLELQLKINPKAPKSSHVVGKAVDVRDSSGALGKWCLTLEGLAALTTCGLYLEHPAHTPTWVHLQTTKPRSGNLVFIP